jgi:serine/threonine protein kinase
MTATQTSAPDSVGSLLGQVLDEFLERQGRGEPADVEAYAQRYPELATVLRQMLPTLQLMQQPADDLAASADPAVPPGYVPGYLGDYRIVREVGRGGMGIVYEAEQVSLSRKVALKVLPFAAAMDPKQLQRFKNEAQAAAQLHHQHIVPVYGVGCDRGVHYYAMQHIEGQTLAATVEGLRHEREGINPAGTTAAFLEIHSPPAAAPEVTPPAGVLSTEGPTKQPGYFRTVARLGVQAAEALEHAHQMGIVHRDIKPANLLVDVRSNLWITDFGLARFQSDAGLTLSGDLLGTLRYMSPEQALAKHGVVDHRTDIYSLGATLYELLTLQPVCSGDERHDVLQQIEREDPRPPRSLNPAVPADLEIIVLKALAKDLDGRYATAQELADDLYRFLEDKPIRAKRPTPWQRVRKWVRRHQAMVVTAGVAAVIILLTVVVALIVGILQVKAAQRRTEEEHQAALAAQERAEENYRLFKESYRLARDRLEECVNKMTDDARLKSGELANLLLAVRTVEKQFYQQFVELRGKDPDFQVEQATTLRKLARVTATLGTREEAAVHYARAEEILATLVREHPDVRPYQALLAQTHDDLGDMYRQTARWREAEQAYHRALALQRVLVSPLSPVPEYQADLATSHIHLGLLYLQRGRLREAEHAYQEALALQEELILRHSKVPRYQYDLAANYGNLAVLYMKTRRLEEAEQVLEKSLALQEKLVKENWKYPRYRAALAHTYNNLCYVYQHTYRLDEADQALQKALALKQVLVKDYPLVREYAIDLAGTQCNLGGLVHQLGRHESSLDWFALAIATLEDVVSKEPRHAQAQEFLRSAYQGRFQVLNETRRYAESLHDADRLLGLLKESPTRDDFRLDRAVTLARLQRQAEATAEAEDVLRSSQSSIPRLYKSALVYALSVAAAWDTDPRQAEHYALRTVQLLQQAVSQGYEDVEALKENADFDAVRQRPDFQKLLEELEQSQEIHRP